WSRACRLVSSCIWAKLADPVKALDEFVARALSDLEGSGLLRQSHAGLRAAAEDSARALGRPVIDASSNDYLALAREGVSRETLVQSRAPSGAGASRLIHGTDVRHVSLETDLARWVGLESALLFATGYSANVGLAQALGGPSSVFISDQLNHASIIDGCRLSRARVEVVPHLSLSAVERSLVEHSGAALRCVVTESYFSMDGDGPDLRSLRSLCDRHGAALVVDEAHALGVFGPQGAGRCLEAGVVPDAVIGTLGKAVGVHGAFVAGSKGLRELLWNRARSFVFSTAPSPLLAELARFHVQRAMVADEERLVLHQRAAALRASLDERGLRTVAGSFGPIVPVMIGDERRALGVVEGLAAQGVLAQAIRPPTVSVGTSRVRLTAKANWSEETPGVVASALAAVLRS
ncbi:MAG TPA: aminotransferase class I/II-fold pyridoxal phosphate-dependent enzyme, partial [Polyangiaceae bacterium]|nr:aminotransferase class I/II-fold pyridoxal phosphate-dependent enzyme [Polyangiaceae bacterium]